MISAFGVDHGDELSKTLLPIRGVGVRGFGRVTRKGAKPKIIPREPRGPVKPLSGPLKDDPRIKARLEGK